MQLFGGRLSFNCAILANPRPECIGCDQPLAKDGDGGLPALPIYSNETLRAQYGDFASCPSNCTLPDDPVWRFQQADPNSLCSMPLPRHYPERVIRGRHVYGYACEPGWWCVDTGENPNYGITSFDNILAAWLTIFQCVTMTNWTDIMYQMQDTFSQLSFIYFILLVIFTAYFGMNLAVAVLVTTFRAHEEKKNSMELTADDALLTPGDLEEDDTRDGGGGGGSSVEILGGGVSGAGGGGAGGAAGAGGKESERRPVRIGELNAEEMLSHDVSIIQMNKVTGTRSTHGSTRERSFDLPKPSAAAAGEGRGDGHAVILTSDGVAEQPGSGGSDGQGGGHSHHHHRNGGDGGGGGAAGGSGAGPRGAGALEDTARAGQNGHGNSHGKAGPPPGSPVRMAVAESSASPAALRSDSGGGAGPSAARCPSPRARAVGEAAEGARPLQGATAAQQLPSARSLSLRSQQLLQQAPAGSLRVSGTGGESTRRKDLGGSLDRSASGVPGVAGPSVRGSSGHRRDSADLARQQSHGQASTRLHGAASIEGSLHETGQPRHRKSRSALRPPGSSSQTGKHSRPHIVWGEDHYQKGEGSGRESFSPPLPSPLTPGGSVAAVPPPPATGDEQSAHGAEPFWNKQLQTTTEDSIPSGKRLGVRFPSHRSDVRPAPQVFLTAALPALHISCSAAPYSRLSKRNNHAS